MRTTVWVPLCYGDLFEQAKSANPCTLHPMRVPHQVACGKVTGWQELGPDLAPQFGHSKTVRLHGLAHAASIGSVQAREMKDAVSWQAE